MIAILLILINIAIFKVCSRCGTIEIDTYTYWKTGHFTGTVSKSATHTSTYDKWGSCTPRVSLSKARIILTLKSGDKGANVKIDYLIKITILGKGVTDKIQIVNKEVHISSNDEFTLNPSKYLRGSATFSKNEKARVQVYYSFRIKILSGWLKEIYFHGVGEYTVNIDMGGGGGGGGGGGSNKYKLVIGVKGSGSTSPRPGTHTYPKGKVVKVHAYPGKGYKFSYWLLDGAKKTENPISVKMDRDHRLIAVFSKSSIGKVKCVRIDDIRVHVFPANYTGYKSAYGEANRLLKGEWFVALLEIRSSIYTIEGNGGFRKAVVNIYVPEASWYKLYRLNKEIGFMYTQLITIDKAGLTKIYVPVEPMTWKSASAGLWKFIVKYYWSNGHRSGSGTASVDVMVADASLPDLSESGGHKGTYVDLYWLPVSINKAYIVVIPYWPDNKPIEYREWFRIKSFLNPRISCCKWDISLNSSKWSNIKKKILVYRNTRIFKQINANLDTGVFYKKVNLSEIEIQGLSNYAILSFNYWFPRKQIKITELATPVYGLRWDKHTLQGWIKIIEWDDKKPVDEGWIIILIIDWEINNLLEKWYYANPYASFKINIPSKYEVWSIGIAPAKNKIYLNNKYGKIILKENRG